ncbi:MAG: hypothetical protein RLZZ214_4033 [Verrucomicrobiota bacterium]|jgi:hypothetical protein
MTIKLLPALAMVTRLMTPQVTAADVVVYGGVPCGIAAAIAATREGAKVVLIEPTKHVGGLSTSGINTAETEHLLKWTVGGIALEFYQRLGKHYGSGKPEFYFESGVAEKVYLEMLAEAGVTVRYGLRVESTVTNNARIESIGLSDGSKLHAKVFIDAGYEGDLMARAGVSSTFGRESKAEYGEELAGIRFDPTVHQAATVDAQGNLLPGISAWVKDLKEGDAHPGTMNYNFRLCFAKDPASQVPIPAPRHYDRGRFALLENWLRGKTARDEPVQLTELLDFYQRRNGKYEVNNKQAAIFSLGHFGGQFGWPGATYGERDKIFADHWDYTLGLLKFLAGDESVPPNVRAEMKAWGVHKDEFADNGNLPYQLYVREARRMLGETVVTQKDVQTDRRKPDSIGIASHFIDCHHVQRLAVSPTGFINEGRIWRTGLAYQIPYRALTPKPAECENLLVPGAASYTHVAFCTYRLESAWMVGGHAAGVAAAMAAAADTAVQKVDVPALQEKLRAQHQIVDFIPGEPENWTDIHKGTNGPEEF